MRVTVRALHSDQFIGAGSTVLVRDTGTAPVPGGSPGTFDAEESLHSGDSYVARVYTPRPTATDLDGATIPGPRVVDGVAYTSPLYAYLTVALPRRAPGGGWVASGGDAAPGDGGVAFPPFGRGGAPAAVQRGVALGSGPAALHDSPYARVYALARRLAAGARTPYQYVRAVEAYLAKGFSYSENPPRRSVPLASFLLADRTGYCQQFSGAMALLLRMGGVPARVATGFAPGGYNRARGEYVVRDDDAHSWVEVYFQPYGWVPFDPTPVAAPPASQAQFGSAASAGTPDPHDTGAGRHAAPNGAFSHRQSGAGPLPVLALLALAAAVLGAVALALPLRRRRARIPGDPYLAELERALRRTGRWTGTGTTLRGLERRLANLPGAAGYLAALRAHRFAVAAPAPTPAQRRALRRALGRGGGWSGRARALWALPPRLH